MGSDMCDNSSNRVLSWARRKKASTAASRGRAPVSGTLHHLGRSTGSTTKCPGTQDWKQGDKSQRQQHQRQQTPWRTGRCLTIAEDTHQLVDDCLVAAPTDAHHYDTHRPLARCRRWYRPMPKGRSSWLRKNCGCSQTSGITTTHPRPFGRMVSTNV